MALLHFCSCYCAINHLFQVPAPLIGVSEQGESIPFTLCKSKPKEIICAKYSIFLSFTNEQKIIYEKYWSLHQLSRARTFILCHKKDHRVV